MKCKLNANRVSVDFGFVSVGTLRPRQEKLDYLLSVKGAMGLHTQLEVMQRAGIEYPAEWHGCGYVAGMLCQTTVIDDPFIAFVMVNQETLQAVVKASLSILETPEYRAYADSPEGRQLQREMQAESENLLNWRDSRGMDLNN